MFTRRAEHRLLLREDNADLRLTPCARELALDGGEDFARIDDRLPREIRAQLEVLAKYSGYIERQHEEIERQRRHEQTRLPDGLDYAAIPGLSSEVRQKLAAARPGTLGQAARIPGITPAAISILLIWLKKRTSQAA